MGAAVLIMSSFQSLDFGVLLVLLYFSSHSWWGGKCKDVLYFAFHSFSPFVSDSDLSLVFNTPLIAFRNDYGEGREAL